MLNDDLWERAGHPGSIDNDDLVKASQDVPISREELGIESPDTEDGLKEVSEGIDLTDIFKDDSIRHFIIIIAGMTLGAIIFKLIMMIPD